MAGLFPRLTGRESRGWALAAAVLALVAIAYALWRADLTAAGIILAALAVLAAAYVWSKRDRDDEGEM